MYSGMVSSQSSGVTVGGKNVRTRSYHQHTLHQYHHHHHQSASSPTHTSRQTNSLPATLHGRLWRFLRDAWSGMKEVEDDGFDDMGTESVHYKPEAIDTLCELTKFNKRELQLMYRGFKQECPSGMVREETFKGIYAQFFPRGADSSQYAHFVFNTFDQDHTGAITFTDFVIGMSVLARGSVQEKLRWAFNLYDINGDGYITKDEMTRIVAAIYDLMGKAVEPVLEEHTTRDHVDRVFKKLDLNNDGVVTIEEFLDSCIKDENITQSMSVFNTEL